MYRTVSLFLALISLGVTKQLEAAERPNILFLFSDDHAIKAISAYGGPLAGVVDLSGVRGLGVGIRLDDRPWIGGVGQPLDDPDAFDADGHHGGSAVGVDLVVDDVRRFDSGNVLVTYQPAGRAGARGR